MLVCDDDGTVLDVIERKEPEKEEHGLEYYSGILTPGFVNVHCHLELSHLRGKIEEKKGIGHFIGKINRLRNEGLEKMEQAIQTADRKMWAAGIAAVGDISNSTLTVQTKKNGRIYYHTFVESFGFHPDRAEKSFRYATAVWDEFRENGLAASVTPHSPYSVSAPLFERIKELSMREKSILSIHNQESKAEALFYSNGSGPIADHLKNNLHIDISHWEPTGHSSLVSILKYLPAENPLLLVHNTFTTREDLGYLKKARSLENTWFALCPNSNLYIENQLPPVDLLRNENLNICLGTDSLASNHDLSVLSEMKTIQEHFPGTGLAELLTWAGMNGARALGIENTFGSFEKGKKPGVNLITGVDLKTMTLTGNCRVKRLL